MDDKLIGALITSVEQLKEVADFSTAVKFIPDNAAQVTEYLNAIDKKLVPIIAIDNFFKEEGRYTLKYNADLDQAIAQSTHYGRIVFCFDEPMWQASKSGQSHDETLDIIRGVKENYPKVEIMHIEAYAELYNQYTQNNGQLKLFYDADHIGFDYYGDLVGCPQNNPQAVQLFVYLMELYKAIKAAGSNASLFLVPGAFIGTDHFSSVASIIDQLHYYIYVFINNLDKISGIGIFTWGDLEQEGIVGIRNSTALDAVVRKELGDLMHCQEKYKVLIGEN